MNEEVSLPLDRVSARYMQPPVQPPSDEPPAQIGAGQLKQQGGWDIWTNEHAPTSMMWFCDGSKTDGTTGWGKAGAAACNMAYEVMARVPGPQTSYRAEMFAALLAAEHALPHSTIYLDNKAVVEGGCAVISREVSDVDLRLKLQPILMSKHLTLQWIPSHRQVGPSHTPEERYIIEQNNRVDGLAKKASTLPEQWQVPNDPQDIFLYGCPAPTPARKWILHRRRTGTWEGLHWTTWLPMRGQRRMLWLQWLWGNVRWRGCGPPWSKEHVQCSLCGESHRETVHGMLQHCPRWWPHFKKLWLLSWSDWQPHALAWLNTADGSDLQHITCLRVPITLINAIPDSNKFQLRQRVAWHQYHMLLGVVKLRSVLPLPPCPTSPAGPTGITQPAPWYTKLQPKLVSPSPTPQRLHRQVGLPMPAPFSYKTHVKLSEAITKRRAVIIAHMKPGMYRRLQALSLLPSLTTVALSPLRRQIQHIIQQTWESRTPSQPSRPTMPLQLREHKHRISLLQWKDSIESLTTHYRNRQTSLLTKSLLIITRKAYTTALAEGWFSFYTIIGHLASLMWATHSSNVWALQVWSIAWWTQTNGMQCQWRRAINALGTTHIRHSERQLYLQLRRNAQCDHNFPISQQDGGPLMEVRTDIPVIALPTPISDLAHSKRPKRPVYSEMAIEEMEVPLTQVHHFTPTSNFSLPKGSRKRLYSQLTIEEMEIPLSHLPPLPPDSMQGAQPYGSSSEPNSDRHHRRRQ